MNNQETPGKLQQTADYHLTWPLEQVVDKLNKKYSEGQDSYALGIKTATNIFQEALSTYKKENPCIHLAQKWLEEAKTLREKYASEIITDDYGEQWSSEIDQSHYLNLISSATQLLAICQGDLQDAGRQPA